MSWPLLFLSILAVTAPLGFSRTTPSTTTTTTTTVLDVASSLRKTLDVLSSSEEAKADVLPFEQQQSTDVGESSSSSLIKLHLHPRPSVQNPLHLDYSSLTLSRLARDSARVSSLVTRLDLALQGLSSSDLKPLDRVFTAADLEAPVVSGTSQGSGEYFSRIGIGNPPSQVYVVIDTGSDVNWVQCAPCADCYQQADPIFEPASSSSFTPLTCEAQQCRSLDVSECRNGSCLYEVAYGDGSYTVGDFATETITLGSAKIDNIAIGCGHNNEGLFVGAAGLLGLGGGSLSLPSQLNATSFSYCLVDRDSDSASTLEFDSSLPPDAITAPLVRNPQLDTFLYVELTGISVGGTMLPLQTSVFKLEGNGNGGTIVDSGTAVTRLQTDVYNALRDAFVKGARNLRTAEGFALFDTCYDLSSESSVEVPTVSFHFGEGRELPLPAKNYMIPVDSNGTFCFAFAPTSSALSIVGNVQQQGTRVGFDLVKSVVGFVPNKC